MKARTSEQTFAPDCREDTETSVREQRPPRRLGRNESFLAGRRRHFLLILRTDGHTHLSRYLLVLCCFSLMYGVLSLLRSRSLLELTSAGTFFSQRYSQLLNILSVISRD